MTSDAELALRALRLLDLTDLSERATETGALQLCARAVAAPGPVAAVCLWHRDGALNGGSHNVAAPALQATRGRVSSEFLVARSPVCTG